MSQALSDSPSDAPDIASSDAPTHRGRRIGMVVLIVLTSILAPLAVDAVWVRDTALDTDAFIAQVGPMIDDPGVQQQLVDTVTTDLTSRLDLESKLENDLPSSIQFLAGPLDKAITRFVHDITEKIVTSDKFSELFKKILTKAHAELVKTLEGGGKYVKVDEGTITLDLTELRSQVVKRIDGSKLGSFVNLDPNKSVTITLAHSTALAKGQQFVKLLKVLGWVLPVLTLLAAVASVVVAPDHRRGLMWVGIGGAIAMAVHLVALAVGRNVYLDVVTKTLDKSSSGTVYDLLVQVPRDASRAIFLLFMLVAFGAAVAGPTDWAVHVRGLFASVSGRAGSDVADLGPLASVGGWVASHRRGVQAIVLGGGALILVAADRLSVATILWTAVGVVVGLFVIAVLASAGSKSAADSTKQ